MEPTVKFTSYMPLVREVDPAYIQNVRERLVAYSKAHFPLIDPDPNTPYGDLVITPLATQVAALEIAAGRMFSDLNLENVANNVIYNCDFTRKYLRNFAIVDRDNLKARGIVRLLFHKATMDSLMSRPSGYYLDAGAQYIFNDTNIFTAKLPFDGHIHFRFPTGSKNPNTNYLTLNYLDDTTYMSDLSVEGSMPGSVSDGTEGGVDRTVEGLESVVAKTNFEVGLPPESLPQLAARARQTFYSASLTTRGGIISFLSREFPQVRHISPVISGDYEMKRDTVNILGVRDGRVDTYVRSSSFFNQDSQIIKIPYISGQDMFIGKMELTQSPIYVNSVKPINAEEVLEDFTIYSKSNNPEKAPLATACYSSVEDLYLTIPMPRDSDGLPLIDVLEEGSKSFGLFEVSYLFDPLFTSIQNELESLDNKPVGSDIVVKHFIPIIFKKFLVKYSKKRGTIVNLSKAKKDIFNYVNSITYPEHIDQGMISEIMLLSGATGATSIDVQMEVQWTVADKILSNTQNVTTAVDRDAARVPYLTKVYSINEASISLNDPREGIENGNANDETLVSIGPRNLSYILPFETIQFEEGVR